MLRMATGLLPKRKDPTERALRRYENMESAAKRDRYM